MASLIPSLSSCLKKMQPGEKRFARTLESHLEDDYLCWYEPSVGKGKQKRYTDFIVLHPRRGLLLLEVKDWLLSSIESIDRQSVSLFTQNGSQQKENPLEQARQCSYQLINALQTDPALRQSGGKYDGNLSFPYAFGVVLSNITRTEFDDNELGDILPEHLVMCKNEFTPSIEIEAFQERLWNMFKYQFKTPMSMPQIDRIRWHLFPEIRIGEPVQKDLFEPEQDNPNQVREEKPEDLFPDIVRVMDLAQEKLARNLGTGHRVIHGVAGSGKTLILGYRCQQLSNLYRKPILVICFNVTLAAKLREMINQNELGDQVHIRHFHDWCGEQLRNYHVPPPAHGSDYVKELVNQVIYGVSKGQIPSEQYSAVMIDEGHDFEPTWLQLVVSMIDPESNSLLLLYDDAQSLYSNKKELGFSLSSVGIKARGRTTVLKINYRNTDEIIKFAYEFASNWLIPEDADEDNIPLIEPKSAGRHGPDPVVKVFSSFDEEAKFIARCVQSINQRGTPLTDIAITYRSTWMGQKIHDALASIGVAVHWLKDSQEKKKLSQQDKTVKLMTMHSSKGLEYPFVVVAGIGDMPLKQANIDPINEAKLLYVAMTRATEKLLITAHNNSPFVQQLLGKGD